MPNLCYSPVLHNDELLYSWVGRLGELNAYCNPKDFMGLIYGNRNALISPDLPCRLRALVSLLGENFPFESIGATIEQGTLYPYHRPFVDVPVHESVVRRMEGNGNGLKLFLGRVANRFRASAPLKYCPICLELERANWGYGIWHRSHNVPSALCCHKHAILLKSSVNPTEQSHRGFIVMPPRYCHEEIYMRPTSGQLRMTIFGVAALHAGVPSIPAQVRAKLYLRQAQRKGYLKNDGSPSIPSLGRAICERYDDFEGIAFRERLLATENNPMRWIRDLLFRPERSLHPIMHLLLIDILWGSWQSFVDEVALVINGDETEKEKSKSHSSSIEKKGFQDLDDDESLSCRSVAAKLGVAINTIVQHRLIRGSAVAQRPKKISSALRNAILCELKSGATAAEIAEKRGLSTSSVYRLRAVAKRELSELAAVDRNQVRQKKREEWMALLKAAQEISVIRSTRPDLYAWLYRDDRGWLISHNKSYRHAHIANGRVDWARRDRELCGKAKLNLQVMLKDQSRGRVTRAALRRHLDDAMIRANRENLPMFTLLEDRLQESIFQFQRYRSARAVAHLRSVGLPIVGWRIQRLAGMRELGNENIV
ncbi:hypothetical protein E2K99_23070 [Herbaspirillum huttiense]|nr:hypothetical protein E2K99_23070 [Herbaspirillum huttiense]